MDRMLVIDLWQAARECGDCPMCDQYRRLNHAVAWWQGPVRYEIGQELLLTDGTTQEVGGMPVCQPCHDAFYAPAETEKSDAGRKALEERR